MNPYLDKSAVRDKQSILDIRARAADGTFINIEIQLLNRHDMGKRTLFYWAKMYSSQLEEGELYKGLCKTITINILDFDFIKNDRYHNIFHLREDATSVELTDDIEIHFVELRKLREHAQGLTRRLVRWMLFIGGFSRDGMEELTVGEPAIRKALTTLEFVSQDAEARQLYEDRRKAIRDELSAIEGAKEVAHKEGREEGRQEKAVEIARGLLSMGIQVGDVAEVTGLTEKDIEQVRMNLD